MDLWELVADDLDWESTPESVMSEILTHEAMDAEEKHNEHWIRMENGVDWMPESAMMEGDRAELQGLWDDGVFEVLTWDQVPENCRVIGIRLVRRIQQQKVKSRYVLHDFAHGRPAQGGDVHAATPSMAAWRLLLALASHKMQTVPDFVAVIGDITRAFPHADIDTFC